MNLNRRSFLMTTAVGVLASTTVSAFPQGAGGVKLGVQYAYASTYDSIMKEIVAKFAVVRPDIQVEIVAAATDYGDLAQRTMRAAIAGGMPDLTIGGLNTVELLAERKVIAPLKPLIAKEADWQASGYTSSILSLGSVAGEPYCLPFTIAIKSVYYNLELVKRAGGDPENLPKSWDEVIALQKKIQALGNGINGLYADYYFDDNNFCFHSWVQAQGGSIATPEGKVAFGGKEGLQALKWLRGFGEAGMIDMTVSQAYQAFTAGTLGILIASSSRITQLTNGTGDRFPIKVVAFPRSENGTIPGGGASVMIHAKSDAKLQAAWEFAKFVTGPVGSTEMVQRAGYLPGNDRVINDERYLKSFYDKSPAQRTMVEQLPLLTKWYNWSGENALKIPIVIRDHMQQVVALKKTPEETIGKMVSDVQALLKA
ncbi:extracellular solute-binding protein [Rhizobium miluonense]|uniref:Multiple sugar transport system substrate-binding protein n=1 Tax=Rhizobium miluonense TaxID=411945 RepID=A0A1C3WDE0_9HYPH|nr:extracellular solute-binding protein [Rhizobium miluonense]SCB37973.1 multiple sugar transport system substrate-binding protein [Rhizobium miluonense]